MANLFQRLAVTATLGVLGTPVHAQLQFEEVTADAGLAYAGASWGVSWGDVNGDGWPDLWVSNHASAPALLVNNQDGTFTDAIGMVTGASFTDTHGASWADYDNDGDDDLIQLSGGRTGVGSRPNHLLRNDGHQLLDVAATAGIDYPLGRGRTPLWLDWNGDRFLDLLVANAIRPDDAAPTALFTQLGGNFTDSVDVTGLLTDRDNAYAQLVHTTAIEHTALVVQQRNPFPEAFVSYLQTPFSDISNTLVLPSTDLVRDSAMADFNGDLMEDWYLARMKGSSGVQLLNSTSLVAALATNASEHGFHFRAQGPLAFKIDPAANVSAQTVHIGSTGMRPASTRFTLRASDRGVAGWQVRPPGTAFGVYIGYSAEKNLWFVFASSTASRLTHVSIDTTSPISEVVPMGFVNVEGARGDKLLLQSATGFTDSSSSAGLDEPRECESVVAADFDNDTDVDLYLVCRGPASNAPNVLYENNGFAQFTAVPGAGGAEGSALGRGDVAAAADFDRDGFMDIFVANGAGSQPFNSGPNQLFRNLGNSNNWVQFDLQGTRSNRDGIGARVVLTAGGQSQVRLQNGGMHRGAQDHARLHFGLGQNAAIDSVQIQWPSGVTQWLTDVPINVIQTIVEPAEGR